MPEHAISCCVYLSAREGWQHHLSTVFAAITATFLVVIDQLNNCMLIGQFGLIAVVSYDFVLCNT